MSENNVENQQEAENTENLGINDGQIGLQYTNPEAIHAMDVEQTFEKNTQVADLDAEGVEGAERKPFPKINYRHPHQVLTTKEMQLLLFTPEEERNENDRLALNMLKLRLKFHGGSKPAKLSSKERQKKRVKRKMAKASRKVNR